MKNSMYSLLSVIGARPQIIKSAAISRAIKNNYSGAVREIILHTGQHYDQNMSEIFFNELQIPKPNYNLNVGSGNHGAQTAKMIKGIEEVLLNEAPSGVILYGDTNSTLAGAIAASKLHIPIFHIEAGLRSFNKGMPEEINRIVCDHASTLLFSPTDAGIRNLIKEGFSTENEEPYTIDNPGVFHVGDVMYDNSLYFATLAEEQAPLKEYAGLNLQPGCYILATIHRDSNTDNSSRLNNIFRALLDISEKKGVDIVLPLHPRTAKMLNQNLETGLYKRVISSQMIKITQPASFFEMITLEKNALMVMTDSGGVQKESYFFKKPCLIFRPETEWIEILDSGSALLVDADYDSIMDGYVQLLEKNCEYPQIFGDGRAAEAIMEVIMRQLVSPFR